MRTNMIRNDRMAITYDVINGWTVIEVDGEVDAHTAPLICEAMIKLLDEGHRHFVLDLSIVPFLDSMGLRMVVAVTKSIRDREGSLRITCTSSRILRVFEFTGLGDAYEFYSSPEDATRRGPLAGGPGRPRGRTSSPAPATPSANTPTKSDTPRSKEPRGNL
ncbi:STAS domain-containing protein [Streptomyces sp. NPDC005708]|uniref:STAS domain-containing protein n=1 Tax=Streptomyces sp. NPDC005708 TaxID=3154564 RepID=UPI0033F63A7B